MNDWIFVRKFNSLGLVIPNTNLTGRFDEFEFHKQALILAVVVCFIISVAKEYFLRNFDEMNNQNNNVGCCSH